MHQGQQRTAVEFAVYDSLSIIIIIIIIIIKQQASRRRKLP